MASLGDVALLLNNKRQPLSTTERAKRPGPYPYYGAAGQLDSINAFAFDGLHLLIGEDGTVVEPSGCPMRQLVKGRFWVSNHAHVMQGVDESDTRFLYYALGSVMVAPHVTGSAQPKLSLGNLKKILIPWPKIEVRRAIAEVLGALDDKIESNKRIEELLQKLRSLKLSELVDSARVSGRWDEVELSEVMTAAKGRIGVVEAPQFSATVRGLEPRSLTFKKELSLSASKNKRIEKGDLAFGLSRRELNFGVMTEPIGSVSPVYEIFHVDGGLPMAELIDFQIRREMTSFMDILKPGAREGQPIEASFLLSRRMYLPKSTEVEKELLDATLIQQVMQQFQNECSRLADTRNVLLPELISGRVCVNEAADLVGSS